MNSLLCVRSAFSIQAKEETLVFLVRSVETVSVGVVLSKRFRPVNKDDFLESQRRFMIKGIHPWCSGVQSEM